MSRHFVPTVARKQHSLQLTLSITHFEAYNISSFYLEGRRKDLVGWSLGVRYFLSLFTSSPYPLTQHTEIAKANILLRPVRPTLPTNAPDIITQPAKSPAPTLCSNRSTQRRAVTSCLQAAHSLMGTWPCSKVSIPTLNATTYPAPLHPATNSPSMVSPSSKLSSPPAHPIHPHPLQSHLTPACHRPILAPRPTKGETGRARAHWGLSLDRYPRSVSPEARAETYTLRDVE